MKKLFVTVFLAFIASLGIAQTIQKATDRKGNLYLEKDGKKIVNAAFEKVSSYNDKAGLIPAKLDGKWGFYDNDGQLVIAHFYEALVFQHVAVLEGWFVQDRIQVQLDGKRIFIDKSGKEASAPEYELVIETSYPGAGYYFKKGGKWAFADKDKKVLTEFKYDKIVGPISVNPYAYKASRDGQDFRLDAMGREEAYMEAPANSGSSSAKKEKAENCTYKCQKCSKTTQGNCNSNNNGITVENCFAQQPDPKKSRKNHEWRKQ